MAELPVCPNHRAGTCERSDVLLLRESEEFITVGCRTCRSVHVVSLPFGKGRARYQNWIEEQKRLAREERAREQRPKYF